MRITKNIINWLFYISILFSLLLFTYRIAAIEYEESSNKENAEMQTITHQEIIGLTDQFMEQLVQEIDDDYKVIHFDTKEALKASFDAIAKREVTNEYIDFYYEETTEGLYILPTETPPWFIEKNDYNVIQSNEKQIKVKQENETDLYGKYTITYEFTFDGNGHWKITKINVN